MSDFEKVFGKQTAEQELSSAVERLVFSVQVALQQSMHSNCVTQKKLAERLGLSPARVSQILTGDQANLTLKTIAKIAHALGEDFELVARESCNANLSQVWNDTNEALPKSGARQRGAPWQDLTANSNRFPELHAA